MNPPSLSPSSAPPSPHPSRVVRTSEFRFTPIPDFSYVPQYVEVGTHIDDDGDDGGVTGLDSNYKLRMAVYDVGPRRGRVILLLHGEPSWSFLYRRFFPLLIQHGYRVVAIDLIGFGRSDKLTRTDDYTYERHVAWLTDAFLSLKLTDVILFAQDWGGMLGLRVVAAHPHLFAGVIVANTGLPTGDTAPTKAFESWRKYCTTTSNFRVGNIVAGGCNRPLTQAEIAAYDAPFPSPEYQAGARVFPMLVPTTPTDPSSAPNRKAWLALQQFTKPFLCCFSDQDPVTKGGDAAFLASIPGARYQRHTEVKGAGHFLQEDAAEILCEHIHQFVTDNFTKPNAKL